jgi:hypothetical protein
MATGKTLTVYLAADLKKFTSGMNQAKGQTQGFSDNLNRFLKPALLGAGAAAGAFATKVAIDAVGAASDLAETQNKVGVIFGDSSKSVLDFADNAVTALGQTRVQALEASATFAQFGKSAGLSGTSLVNFSTELVTLSADLASFNNSSPEEAINAIGSALRGEAEPMRRFGVLLDDATLKAKALEMGIYSGSGALTQQQKVLSAHQVILSQTTDAQGDFARTADGLANTQRILTAAVEDAKAEIGEGLVYALEAATGAMGGSQGMAGAIQDAGEGIGDLTRGLGLLIGKLAELTEQTDINTGATDEAVTAQTRFGDGSLDLIDKILPLIPILGAYAQGLKTVGEDSRIASDAIAGVYDSTIALAKAQRFAAYDAAQAKKGLIETAYDSGIAQKKEAEWTATMTKLLGHVPGYIAPVNEETKKLTSSRGSASAETEKLTKKEKELTKAYEEQSSQISTTRSELSQATADLVAAQSEVQSYKDSMKSALTGGIDLGAAYEGQFNEEGQKTGQSLLDGFNAQIAQAEWFGNVLTAIKAKGADDTLIAHIASLGPATGGALGEEMLSGDGGLVSTLNTKWNYVQETTSALAMGLVPEFKKAGVESGIETVNSLAEQLGKEGSRLTKLGKRIGKPVGAAFKAQILSDVAAAVKEVQTIQTAARAEAVALESARQAVITEQALGQVMSRLIVTADQRLGTVQNPLVA